jgi:hypothetical protein
LLVSKIRQRKRLFYLDDIGYLIRMKLLTKLEEKLFFDNSMVKLDNIFGLVNGQKFSIDGCKFKAKNKK